MENDKVNVALNALNDLVRDELDATDAGRYHRAGRVLTLAASLTSLHARRVADAVDQENAVIGEDDGDFAMGQVGMMNPMRRARRFVTPGEDMVRQLVDVLPRVLAAQRAVPPGRELAELLDVRERLRGTEDEELRARVQRRIVALVDLTTATGALIGAASPSLDPVVGEPGEVTGSEPAMMPDRMYDIGENDAPEGIDAVFATEGEVG